MNKAKLIMVEGARNCGKTHLILNLQNGTRTYKFPFAKYYNECFAGPITREDKSSFNGKKQLFYLTLGYDITILDLYKQGIITEPLIVDRGILSDIIFGMQSGRICMDEAVESWEWLHKEYGEFFEILFIEAEIRKDERNKDMWELYSASETISIYQEFMERVSMRVTPVVNNFDEDSVVNFRKTIENLLK